MTAILRTSTIAVGIFSAAFCSPAAAQTSKNQKSYAAGRTPDGEPDLRGIWEVRATINWNLEGHAAHKGVPPSKSAIVEPADGKIPYQPEARSKRASMNLADDPQAKCFMAGVPRITYSPGPFQIFQSAGKVAIVYQDLHTFRYILTKPGPRVEDLEFWMGWPQGSWDGDTLVVESGSFNDQTWFDKAGNFHSADLHVVEHFTLTGPNTLQYEALIEDPKVFTKPWKIRIPIERHTEPGFRIAEDECLQDAKGALYHTALPAK